MWGNGKNGNGKPVAAITTLIAEGTMIRGDVKFSGGLHLDGTIEGSITAEGSEAVLTLSNKGRVQGKVSASNAVINGQVLGDIVAVERLELAGEARVEGNVYYRVLAMAAGAQVNGKMIYQGEPVRQLAGPEPIPAEA
ncbi:bactofilin family protein [Dokdonella koreensis]|jgi:cytoskeletal protein CcmA (bactofilin family)|uniref:Integral membrane protein CcmA involved in cell shape determination n=1 Tax=Dokdonella koreensis DS-123 TaxID=1300342 RepID=A0A160DX83_9GAMM|nr:polymer-forming cytoskeletal protein [Dokdonella koreensis]ANB19315.1 Integral membrane protein CcmA involved in cell shape determination [Dokdonella koreensis DS-123]